MCLTVKFEFCDGLQMGRNRKELLDIFIFKPWDLKKKNGGGAATFMYCNKYMKYH